MLTHVGTFISASLSIIFIKTLYLSLWGSPHFSILVGSLGRASLPFICVGALWAILFPRDNVSTPDTGTGFFMEDRYLSGMEEFVSVFRFIEVFCVNGFEVLFVENSGWETDFLEKEFWVWTIA